jgi:hypothetical protein
MVSPKTKGFCPERSAVGYEPEHFRYATELFRHEPGHFHYATELFGHDRPQISLQQT